MAKVKVQIINSRAEFEQQIDVCAQLETDQRALEAELDKKVLALKEKYSEQIKSIKRQTDSISKACAVYAQTNPEIFGSAKSAETPLAKYGFRTGQPTVKTLGKLKECDALAAVLKHAEGSQYSTAKYSLDKSAIRFGIERGVEWLKRLFYVEQAESFFIEPKVDGPSEGKK